MTRRSEPGRPKGSRNRLTIVREKFAERALRSAYMPRYAPQEILQRVADGDTSFTDRQIDAAKALLPFALPKLQAISVKQETPPPPAILDKLANASVESLELLRDALALVHRDLERAGAMVIEG